LYGVYEERAEPDATANALRAWLISNVRQKMSSFVAVQIFTVQGVSNRALKAAFVRIRDALGIISQADVDEPRWGPADGYARVRNKNYSLQLLFFYNYRDRSKDELTVAYYGEIPEEELKLIVSLLQDPPLPKRRMKEEPNQTLQPTRPSGPRG
jgi:hypothetical protein